MQETQSPGTTPGLDGGMESGAYPIKKRTGVELPRFIQLVSGGLFCNKPSPPSKALRRAPSQDAASATTDSETSLGISMEPLFGTGLVFVKP